MATNPFEAKTNPDGSLTVTGAFFFEANFPADTLALPTHSASVLAKIVMVCSLRDLTNDLPEHVATLASLIDAALAPTES